VVLAYGRFLTLALTFLIVAWAAARAPGAARGGDRAAAAGGVAAVAAGLGGEAGAISEGGVMSLA
jgi:hypothetical protein